MDTVVEFDGVSKKYSKLSVLEDINLSVRQDDFMVIYGLPSSGKTVLLRLLMGLEDPDSGDIILREKMSAICHRRLETSVTFRKTWR